MSEKPEIGLEKAMCKDCNGSGDWRIGLGCTKTDFIDCKQCSGTGRKDFRISKKDAATVLRALGSCYEEPNVDGCTNMEHSFDPDLVKQALAIMRGVK